MRTGATPRFQHHPRQRQTSVNRARHRETLSPKRCFAGDFGRGSDATLDYRFE
jgi:hypothetical protein